MEDLIDIDGPKDNIKNNRLSNKPLDKSFYLILPPSVHNYLNYIDFFISIRSKEVEKRAIAVITAILITVKTPLTTTVKTAVTPGKRVITIIIAMPVTAGTPLTTTAETTAIPGTRSNQINPSKNTENTSSFKVRFYNDIIVIKESDDIDITALNDKITMPGTITLEIL